MYQTNWSKRVSKVLFIAAALLLGAGLNTAHAQTAHAQPLFGSLTQNPTQTFAVGWNLIRVSYCIAGQSGGVDFIDVVTTTGDTLFATDSIVVADGAQFCANGNAFYIYTPDLVHVQYYLFFPGLR